MTGATDELLFVYGMLRRDARREMHHLLGRCAEFVAEGTYQGRLYLIGCYPAAVPSDSPEERVQGEAYTLRDPDIVLPKLDQYEECGPRFTSPTEHVWHRRIRDSFGADATVVCDYGADSARKACFIDRSVRRPI